jgi:hypothetical protein
LDTLPQHGNPPGTIIARLIVVGANINIPHSAVNREELCQRRERHTVDRKAMAVPFKIQRLMG